MRLAEAALVRAAVVVAAGELPLALHVDPDDPLALAADFALDAPAGGLRLLAVEPAAFRCTAAHLVATPGWTNLAPDWTIGPLRLPARPGAAGRAGAERIDGWDALPAGAAASGGAARIDGWDARIGIAQREAVAIDGPVLTTGVVGVVALSFAPPLSPGRWRLEGSFQASDGRPALVAPRLLRPAARSPLDAIATLARSDGATYAGDFVLAEPADRLLLRPREEAGEVSVPTLSVRPAPLRLGVLPLRLPKFAMPAVSGGPAASGAVPDAAVAAPALRLAGAAPRPAVAVGAPASGPAVSIVTATRDAPHHLARFLATLRTTAYRSFDLTLVDNASRDPAALAFLREAESNGARVMRDPRRFNFAALSNLGAADAAGEVLVFANNDIAFVDPAWLGSLVAALDDAGVGIAGARLLYPDGRVQHAGLVLAGEARIRHAERFLPGARAGYGGRQRAPTRVSAVTGALMAIRAPLFRALGGFDARLGVLLNDADLCLRAGAEGVSSVLVPAATAVHHESATIGPRRDGDLLARGGPVWAFERAEEARLFRARWSKLLDADPCYPAAFDPLAADFRRRLARPRRGESEVA